MGSEGIISSGMNTETKSSEAKTSETMRSEAKGSKDLTLDSFVEVLASKAPTPGGGGAAALCGAIGTALGNMVAGLTIGKKKYADVEEQMISLSEKCSQLQKDFLELIDKDAECFKPLSKAYGLPKGTEEEIAYRDEVIEKCSYDACEVPLQIMGKCAEAMDVLEFFAMYGSKLALSDAGSGVIICKAAMQVASLNVFINTKTMKDRGEAENYNAKARELLYIYESKADNISEMVTNELTGRKKKVYAFEQQLNAMQMMGGDFGCEGMNPDGMNSDGMNDVDGFGGCGF